MVDLPPAAEHAVWYLEGYAQETGQLWRAHLRHFPFRIGRRRDLDLCIPSPNVSQEHAEIVREEGGLRLRDLGSTNGTFVNRQAVQKETRLEEGDIVHFAMTEFRLRMETTSDWATITSTTRMRPDLLPEKLASGTRQFQQMLREKKVVPYFQPIVRMKDASLFGYECLGRSALEALPAGPADLFRIAASLGREAELSQVLREVGVAVASSLPEKLPVFLNTHPKESGTTDLFPSLRHMRELAPGVPLVLEIHEAAVSNVDQMRELRTLLKELDVALAYDDFGAGQARLLELVEVPPDFLKFDMSMIRGIDQAPPARRQLIRTLVEVSSHLGIACLAEGIETQSAANACLDIGFEYAQGFLFGKPLPLATP